MLRPGFPPCPIHYSDRLGSKLGPIPLGLPLLWFSVIIGAREALLCYSPRLGQVSLAAGVGVLALLTDLNLESVAAKPGPLWFWQAHPAMPRVFDPPLIASLAWGLLAGLITLGLRGVRSRRFGAETALATVTLAIFNTVFLAKYPCRPLV